jgi:transposase-like protein
MKNRKVATAKTRTVTTLPEACANELAAVEFMEEKRWDKTPCCPRCGDTDVYMMRDAMTGERSARFLWRCRGCKKQYTVRVCTIMEDSPIPLRHWCYSFWAACASKKGVSALQIQRMTGVTYKSALFMMHRIREAMRPVGGGKLQGTVKVDETYIGGKPRFKGQRKAGRPNPNEKAGVLGMVERDGRVRLRHMADFKAPRLRGAMREHIAMSARLMTDEYNLYTAVGREFKGGHETVLHKAGEYARGDVTTNTIEGVFALLKRGMKGTFHSVTRKHLHRYLSEFEYRWNTRKMDDGARTALAIRSANGKRLTYAQQLAG